MTDEPHIFSGGFFFRFDARRPLGYIVPDWLDRDAWPDRVAHAIEARPASSLAPDADPTHVPGTVMYLPLRTDVRLLQDGLSADLRGASQTILFLRRSEKAPFLSRAAMGLADLHRLLPRARAGFAPQAAHAGDRLPRDDHGRRCRRSVDRRWRARPVGGHAVLPRRDDAPLGARAGVARADARDPHLFGRRRAAARPASELLCLSPHALRAAHVPAAGGLVVAHRRQHGVHLDGDHAGLSLRLGRSVTRDMQPGTHNGCGTQRDSKTAAGLQAYPTSLTPGVLCFRFADAARPPVQMVYAFLPIRSAGFRFIVQGLCSNGQRTARTTSDPRTRPSSRARPRRL